MSKKSKVKREIIGWGGYFAIATMLALLINSRVVVNAKVPSESMENTIEPGDRFLGNRLAYIKEDPERMDIIIFKYPDNEEKMFVKRVIGLPGEKVEIVLGKVYIDDAETPLEDVFIPEEMIGNYGHYYVPEDSYFVLGDNRNHSNDSRFWENTFVKREQIIGKAELRYWPLDQVGLLK